LAKAICSYLRCYLRPSAHNASGIVPGHPVISLYMDSPDLFYYRQGFQGLKNRIKLRIRFYDRDWNHPASLEIKRRVSDVIVKSRAMITREGVREILSAGWPKGPYWPEPSHLVHSKRRAGAQKEFFELCNVVKARGMIYVSYLREIWESPDDDELRVTLDRHVMGSLYDGSGRLQVPARGIRPYLAYFPPDGVVLEMKFTGELPGWMEELVRIFDLVRTSVCKYSMCVETMGLQWGNIPVQDAEMIF
jgi:hypothetical protein